jgi:hypothetical protein
MVRPISLFKPTQPAFVKHIFRLPLKNRKLLIIKRFYALKDNGQMIPTTACNRFRLGNYDDKLPEAPGLSVNGKTT